jgi:hypothetical protein
MLLPTLFDSDCSQFEHVFAGLRRETARMRIATRSFWQGWSMSRAVV